MVLLQHFFSFRTTLFSLKREFSMFFSCIKLWYNHLKIIDWSTQLNLIYSYRTLVPQNIMYYIKLLTLLNNFLRIIGSIQYEGNRNPYRSRRLTGMLIWTIQKYHKVNYYWLVNSNNDYVSKLIITAVRISFRLCRCGRKSHATVFNSCYQLTYHWHFYYI